MVCTYAQYVIDEVDHIPRPSKFVSIPIHILIKVNIEFEVPLLSLRLELFVITIEQLRHDGVLNCEIIPIHF